MRRRAELASERLRSAGSSQSPGIPAAASGKAPASRSQLSSIRDSRLTDLTCAIVAAFGQIVPQHPLRYLHTPRFYQPSSRPLPVRRVSAASGKATLEIDRYVRRTSRMSHQPHRMINRLEQLKICFDLHRLRRHSVMTVATAPGVRIEIDAFENGEVGYSLLRAPRLSNWMR